MHQVVNYLGIRSLSFSSKILGANDVFIEIFDQKMPLKQRGEIAFLIGEGCKNIHVIWSKAHSTPWRFLLFRAKNAHVVMKSRK